MTSALIKETAKKSHKDIMVVGIGNRLLGDEGIGLYIIDNLSQIPMPSNVNFIDCGCDLLGLMSYLNKPQKIIIIDAIRGGGKPGEIYKFNYSKLTTMKDETQSGHQMRTIFVLGLLRSVYPVLADSEITLIGVEPKTLELGNNLSQEVKERIADVTRLVIEEISLRSLHYGEKEKKHERSKHTDYR
jgi:hydrogenase maturation protease